MTDREHSKEWGQSIILVAVAMIALVLFVAVAVDMSNAYYHRRTAQNAADGGALGGVRQLARGINNKKKLDGLVQEGMNDFAERNGIEDTGGSLADEVNANVDGWYVDMDGNRLDGEPMVGNGEVPHGAYGIEAITYITAPTFFGGVFGLSGVPLQARAVSLLKEACTADCVVPITTEVQVLFDFDFPDGEPLTGSCFNIWRESQTEDPTPGLYGWVNWTWQEAVCEDPEYGLRTCPYVDQGTNACDSTVLAENLDPSNCASGMVKVGDWMSSTSGVVNADDVRCWLQYYQGTHDENCDPRPEGEEEPHPFTIPVYDYTTMDDYDVDTPCLRMKDPGDPNTGGLHYHVAGFAKMQLLGFQLSQGTGVVMSGHTGEGCVTYGEEPHNGNRITALFEDFVYDYDTSSECFDPAGTLLSAPRINE